MTRVYIAGPMTGLPDYNYPAFHAAADRLRDLGYHVENPAGPGQVEGWGWLDYMRRALAQLITCDAVALLPDWHLSRGAQVEHDLARSLGLKVHTIAELAFTEGDATA